MTENATDTTNETQKTAYELLWRDWSSDVCSSDLSWNSAQDRIFERELFNVIEPLP